MKELNNFEQKENKEKITSKIDLKFFRHSKKESGDKPDEEIRLTEEGKLLATKKSDNTDISQSIAFGSPRKRTQETAGLIMSGGTEEIKGNESLEELKEKIEDDLEYGSKISVDDRLNFNIDGSTEYGKVALDAFEGGTYLKFLVEESDQLAESLGDTKNDTAGRMTSRIAEIVKKYFSIAPRWDELVQDESKNYEETLKRFFGTHQGNGESFLAKIIEKTKGIEERDNFVRALGNKGFDFTEGFDVEIVTLDDKKQEVKISFKKEKDGIVAFEFNEIVPMELIDNLIEKK